MHIRDADCGDILQIARVHISSWQTTYAGIVPEDYLSNLNIEDRAERWRTIFNAGKELYVDVAVMDAGEIVGFASSGPELSGMHPGMAELTSIYILQEYQGIGIGRQLFERAVSRLKARYSTMLVWALSQNPACDFYIRMGGVPDSETTCEIGGVTLPERSFLFPLG